MAYSKDQIETLFNDICSFISEGNSLRAALRRKGMPDSTTFYKWVDSDEQKTIQYARVCKERQDVLFEQCLEIANTPVEGETITIEHDGKEKVTRGDMIQHRKLQIDTRKWMLGKMNPKKYGDKLNLEHEGEMGINHVITKEALKKAKEELDDEI